MRGAHSIEIKNMLEQNHMKGKSYDPDSDSNLTTYSNTHSHTLKSSDSTSTLMATQSDVSLIQDRYQTLEQDYQLLKAQNKDRRHLFLKQKEQLQRCRNQHIKTQKEIERIKSLISIAKKTEHLHPSASKNDLRGSRVSRKEKHSSSLPRDRNTYIPTNKSPLVPSNTKQISGLKKVGTRQREKGMFGRLKFVPTLVQ